MAFELEKESLRFMNDAGSFASQVMLEGDLIVPDRNPDIGSIIRVGADMVMEESVIREERAGLKGELRLCVMYHAKKSEKPIHSMDAVIPLEDVLHMEGVPEQSIPHIHVKLAHLEYRLINDRKINVKAVVDISAQPQTQTQLQVVTDVEDGSGMQILYENMTVNHTYESKKDRFDVKAEMTLPSDRANIHSVVQSDVFLTDRDIRPMDKKVMVKGVLSVAVLYMGENDESLLETVETEVPFSGYVDAENSREDTMAAVKLSVEKAEIEPQPDEDGEIRSLSMNFVIGADIRIMKNESMQVIEDIYSLKEPLAIQFQSVTYPVAAGSARSKMSIKETVTVPGTLTDMMRVLHVFGEVETDEALCSEDRVGVEGTVHLQLLYIGQDDNTPVQVYPVSIPFYQEMELRGADPGVRAEVQTDVEGISCSMLSGHEAEVRITLCFDAVAYRQESAQVITDIQPEPEQEQPSLAGAVIYVVQKGDTLWKIAKRYHTTVEDIVEINEIENPDRIYPGEKLLILKKVCL